jgi:hypothetical protein
MTQPELTQEQLQQLDKYLKNLKNEELKNQQYFNKKSDTQNNPNDFFNDFFNNDKFFDNMIDR